MNDATALTLIVAIPIIMLFLGVSLSDYNNNTVATAAMENGYCSYLQGHNNSILWKKCGEPNIGHDGK